MRVIVLSAALAALCLPTWAADDVNPAEIIQKFAAKEVEFQQARNNYTYRQTVKMEEVNGGPGGKWEEVEDIIFTPEGKRTEKVVYAPVITLRQISLSPEDVQDLRNVQPFVLTTPEIPDYDIRYLGKEKVDEIGCYTFSVKPKKMEPGKRYFEGQIWVDDRDLQIVKTYGKGVGIVKKATRHFPSSKPTANRSTANTGSPPTPAPTTRCTSRAARTCRIRMTVKYQDYKKYEGRSTIKFGDVVEDGKTSGDSAHHASDCPTGHEEEVSHLTFARTEGDTTPFALTTISCAALAAPTGTRKFTWYTPANPGASPATHFARQATQRHPHVGQRGRGRRHRAARAIHGNSPSPEPDTYRKAYSSRSSGRAGGRQRIVPRCAPRSPASRHWCTPPVELATQARPRTHWPGRLVSQSRRPPWNGPPCPNGT